MFETETVGPCLVQKLKCGTMAPLPPPQLPPPSGYAPASFSCSGFHLLQIVTDGSEADLSNLAVPPRVSQFL